MNPTPPDPSSGISRARFLTGSVATLFTVLGVRLVNLGWGGGNNPPHRSFSGTRVARRLIPHRGEIWDRNGCVLATSEPIVTVCANPSLIADRAPHLATLLEPYLQIDRRVLWPHLRPRPARDAKGAVLVNRRGAPVLVSRAQLKLNFTLPQWQALRGALQKATFGLNPANRKQKLLLRDLRRHAIFAEPAQLRRYQFGDLAAHIIGHVTLDSGASPFFLVGDIKETAAFAAELEQRRDALSLFLWSGFEQSARRRISAFLQARGGDPALQQTLVDELNQVLSGGPIYQPRLFRGVKLSFKTCELLCEYPEGLELARLNRLLLADAYPGQLPRHAPVLPVQIGASGIEQRCDPILRGALGWRSSERDARGRELPRFRHEDIPVQHGVNVALTLDARVQRIVEEELAMVMLKHAPASATALVVHPPTGDILACATLPNYSPAHPGSPLRAAWRNPAKPGLWPPAAWRNRAICDVHELGSVMKMVTATAALDLGVARLTDEIFCENGSFLYKGARLRDHHRYGNLSVEEVLVHSSNIGAAKIALRVGAHGLYEYFRRFGFGKPTGIPLPGERSGTLKPVQAWSGTCITRLAIGYTISATTLQLAMAYSALGNDGDLMRPRLVAGLRDAQGTWLKKYPPARVGSVARPEVCRTLLSVLTGVVSKKGTAPLAALDDFTVSGKTGTAAKMGKKGYRSDAYVATFVGLLPARTPQLCIAIVVDEPTKKGHYGGEVCGPAFAAIGRRGAQVLHIPSDRIRPNAPTMALVP